jgi:hypothetical protein
MDRFRALILKQRLLYFPEGRDIHGVLVEYRTKHEGNQNVSKAISNTLQTYFINDY